MPKKIDKKLHKEEKKVESLVKYASYDQRKEERM